MCNVAGIVFSGAYVNNMKCMYTNVPDYTVDCNELI